MWDGCGSRAFNGLFDGSVEKGSYDFQCSPCAFLFTLFQFILFFFNLILYFPSIKVGCSAKGTFAPNKAKFAQLQYWYGLNLLSVIIDMENYARLAQAATDDSGYVDMCTGSGWLMQNICKKKYG